MPAGASRAGHHPLAIALVTPWYEPLNLSAQELEDLAADTGWRLGHRVDGQAPEYYAVLEKLERVTP